ncbi:AAA family ATPase [Corynebacterium felinum]|uniref:Dethiobiotin synthetase n=1 Tax=Corynebacterium felinum TaxID=131318 RepID=A0ABU2BA88_9CORY|nr:MULTISPECIES: AAA family ATPase [Corynebacterium]MDF5819727.1 AAA family ATPase [Corynebacterium felinum]MDO4761888.1 AAA family ATPase [Corynebacterium sp.]MDR7355554.1 dethiobiotin synthetase [Corynebacterium felinum]WJY94904.1 ATP-dependent dethiobiotin synthetase BioD [Corynebacterium felinum]
MGIVVVSGLASGVGKTTAAAAIVRVLQDRGRDVIPVKVARLRTSTTLDIGTIEKLTGIKGEDFSDALDPIAVVKQLSDAGKTVVVEGSGGLSVPLLGEDTIAHIAAKLDAPLVVVSGMDDEAVKVATQAVHFAHACGASVEGLLGGKLPAGADLRTRLILMEVANATGVPFIGSLNDGVGSLGAEAFAEATQTIFLPEHW